MRNITILIVDDEPSYLELLKGLLVQEGYQEVITEQYPEMVMSILDKQPVDLIILDVYMPVMNGLELLEKINLAYPQIPVIVVTAVDEVEIALKAVKLGAYEYITKPPDTDRLFLTIKRALEQRILELELDSHRSTLAKIPEKRSYFSDIITSSPNVYKVFELVEIFAPTNEMVLITGETGTGKDLIARKIHELSPRRMNPFIAVNLASISQSLFESELFGHEKGSFTGAVSEKRGYFEEANGGTIFLDEVGELPKELQGKLLRTIQYNEIYRIGSAKPIKLDIRIIAATNRNLIEAVNNKEFRADLYYRLNRGLIQLPPLRERGEDVVLLAGHFLRISNVTYNKNISGFKTSVLDSLSNYDFPGNVRELENIIFNLVAKTKDYEIISDINLPVKSTKPKTEKLKLLTIEEAIEEHIQSILNYTSGNLQKTATILGVSERTLQRRIKEIRDKIKLSDKRQI